MGLWAGRRRQTLVHDLRSHIRLLLREDPGREQMVELVRLFDPDARPAGAGRISVDAQRRIYLTQPSAVDPGIAAETRVPPGLPVAYFVQVQGRSAPLDMSGLQREKRDLQETAISLLNGLAIRLGGFAWPPSKAAGDPLQATVYTPRPVAAADVLGVVGRYLPELVPFGDVSLESIGVDSWRTPDGRLQAELWPGRATLMLMHPPAAIGDWRFRRAELSTTVLRLADPANQADPGDARAVAQAALAVATATGGTCVDMLGFRVLQPEDLVMR
jgi:hypothetical protein